MLEEGLPAQGRTHCPGQIPRKGGPELGVVEERRLDAVNAQICSWSRDVVIPENQQIWCMFPAYVVNRNAWRVFASKDRAEAAPLTQRKSPLDWHSTRAWGSPCEANS
ncbi:hypothetical protein AN403_6161 [Pseudomonas fluorescens]|uniref:Uncharacterized protein n=1 Tax=Pseudomonas fluorescens TaxID=294 RepID=A0A0P9BG33_PSEFL|nr:hypothetical protein AN403_6161 [Pseudomonas fluorescens]